MGDTLPHSGYRQPSGDFQQNRQFAKIASLQGATFGIQFKSPEPGEFSPLHAFLDMSVLVQPENNMEKIEFSV